jgi:hypothetical protein
MDDLKDITPNNEIRLGEMIVSIREWFMFFLKRWWIILIACIVGGLFGVWKAYSEIPKYESHLTFALDDGAATDAGGVSSLAAQFGFNLGGSGRSFFSGDNILEIMKSRRIVESVLLSADTINGKHERLIQHYLNFTKEKKTLESLSNTNFPINFDKKYFSYKQDSVLYVIATQFSTSYIKAEKPDKKLDIYVLGVTTMNEKLTKVFTDRILAKTISFYTELRSKKGKETLDILEGRVASMKGNLNSSITTRSSIQDANVNPAFAAAQVPLQKQTANIQVYSGAYNEMFKNLELARFQYLKDVPLLQIIDAADYPMQKIKKGKLKTGLIFAVLMCIVLLLFMTIYRIYKKALRVQEQPS